ncbi:hypothetical protein Sango_1922900 [Sesamum angolense]|uniref:DUF4218 domain-containing protein n=1 Tax=Sesamum angolense TaxID=2727404 RepID=A0AAE1WDS2_9LAMI|nr:hypothetical protein Sango_1922900 [Sesamum angolense]
MVDERRLNVMPKSLYTLTKEHKIRICEWISHFKFPDGYASNLARCMMQGMKSYDCHVFMQKLIPITIHEMFPEPVWNALTEVNFLFQILCSTTLGVNKIQELEARVGRSVQYRWMYPFERFLRDLKIKVKSKAHVGASIVEAYLVEEISLFTSEYSEPRILCKWNKPCRNDDLCMNDTHIQQFIYNYPSRSSGVANKR